MPGKRFWLLEANVGKECALLRSSSRAGVLWSILLEQWTYWVGSSLKADKPSESERGVASNVKMEC